MTSIPPPSRTIFVAPGQSVSDNLSFTAYSVIIQNNTIWYWYLPDARAFIPPGTTHFISPLPGVSVANISFQAPLGLPQPPIPTDGSGGQLVAQFLNETNTASPGYVGYQPMGRNRLVFPLGTIRNGQSFALPVPASDGLVIRYIPSSSIVIGSFTITITPPGAGSYSVIQSFVNVSQHATPIHPIYLPEAFSAGTVLTFFSNPSNLPPQVWITI